MKVITLKVNDKAWFAFSSGRIITDVQQFYNNYVIFFIISEYIYKSYLYL